MTDNSAPTRSHMVVMTGGTSGIGAFALRQLAAEPGTRILLGARGTGRDVPAGVETLPLDLALLDSVRRFADSVTRQLDGTGIDALVLNAGTQFQSVGRRTVDGFETTFAVNHLAHYLLARLLVPHLAEGGRLILTTSDTHDPAIMPLAPRTLDPETLAHPTETRFAAGMRAYAASKLCNLLTARSFADAPGLRARGISVVAFNPGLNAGTNLGNSGPLVRRVKESVVFPVFAIVGRFKPAYVSGDPRHSGRILARLATGTLTPPSGRVYLSLVRGEVTYPDPARLALDDTVRDNLWDRSATMVGIDRPTL